MSLKFIGCPIHKGDINVEKECIKCEHFSGNTGDFFYRLKWCNHSDSKKRRKIYG